jgi:hypothetical protein
MTGRGVIALLGSLLAGCALWLLLGGDDGVRSKAQRGLEPRTARAAERRIQIDSQVHEEEPSARRNHPVVRSFEGGTGTDRRPPELPISQRLSPAPSLGGHELPSLPGAQNPLVAAGLSQDEASRLFELVQRRGREAKLLDDLRGAGKLDDPDYLARLAQLDEELEEEAAAILGERAETFISASQDYAAAARRSLAPQTRE